VDGFWAWWNRQSFMSKLGWILIALAIVVVLLILFNAITPTQGSTEGPALVLATPAVLAP
jgi:hypothetical protein